MHKTSRQTRRFSALLLMTVLSVACGAIDGEPGSVLAGDEPAGACRLNDEQFNTEEGGCLQFSSGNVWSMRAPGRVKFAAAASYCEGIVEGGFADWRLPQRSDLRELAGMDRAKKYLDFSVIDLFWSSTGNASMAVVVELVSGEVTPQDKTSADAAAICMRKPADVDSDGVADSSDVCNGTPKGSLVATQGARKGCAATDALLAVDIGCRKNSDDFVTANGGCHDKRSGLTWSRSSAEPQQMQFADRYCQRLVERLGDETFSGWRIPSAQELVNIAGGELAGAHFKFDVGLHFWSNTVISQYRDNIDGTGRTHDVRPRLTVNLGDGTVGGVPTQYLDKTPHPYVIRPTGEHVTRPLVCVRP